MKIAVLTSSVGATLPAEVSVKYDSADYFAFTEEELIEDSMWTRMPLRKFSIDNRYANRRNAKIYKIMPHLFVLDTTTTFGLTLLMQSRWTQERL